jgi:hypothetical protein
MCSRAIPRVTALALVAIAASCVVQAPPALSTLNVAAADPDAAQFAEIDAAAKAALLASDAKPDDVALAVRAASCLFQAADARAQRATVASCRESDTVAAVLAADDRVPADVRKQVASLCADGLAAAERAVARDPVDAAAHLQRGLCLSLLAWANGAAASLVQGYGPRIADAIDKAVAGDAKADDCAALRLQGRFRSKAPWPLRDREVARTALLRAADEAPCLLNFLFLGDALWLEGDRDGAIAAWRNAVDARCGDSARASEASLRQLVGLRLAAAGGAR